MGRLLDSLTPAGGRLTPQPAPSSDPVAPTPVSQTPTFPLIDFAKGAAKSVGNTVVGFANIGAQVGNELAKIPGLEYLNTKPENMPEAVKPAFLTPSNTTQKVGSFVGDVAQFFVPGGAEAEAGKAVD